MLRHCGPRRVVLPLGHDWEHLVMTAADIARLTLAALLGLVIYAGVCLFWPWTSCRKCEGKARFRSPSGRNWRRCPDARAAAARSGWVPWCCVCCCAVAVDEEDWR